MRISDWSSDVCSSDLGNGDDLQPAGRPRQRCRILHRRGLCRLLSLCEDGRRDASEQRGVEESGDRPACAGHHERNHWLSSFAQLHASTKMPRVFLRTPPAVPGCCIPTVTFAFHCVVSLCPPLCYRSPIHLTLKLPCSPLHPLPT